MIVRGVKTMEIRTWPIKRRGIIALHAPKKIDFGAAYFYGYQRPWVLPRFKIVAVAEIAEVLSLDGDSWQAFLEQHRQPLMVDGAYGARLANVRVLERPVAYGGRLGLFPIAEDVAERVRRFALL
jgi:hypothetical protein